MNCESIHEEYKKLRAKERSANSYIIKGKPINPNSAGPDILRTKELAKELVTKCQDYVASLSTENQRDIKKVASD